MKKMITLLAVLGMILSLAPSAQAAPVVYTLSADGGVLSGTLTFDSSVPPTSTDGGSGNHTYTYPNGALVAFALSHSGSSSTFDNVNDLVYVMHLVTDASFTPLFWMIDMDDVDEDTDFFYVTPDPAGLDLTAGTGNLSGNVVGVGDVFGATLTPAPTGTLIMFE